MKHYLFILCLLITLKLAAQNPVAIQQEKMSNLQKLVGSWSGTGWIIPADGKKHTFNQTEVVTAKMDGGVLTVDGNGKDSETGKPIHTAFAILTFDNAKQSYRWTAVSSGYVTDVAPEVKTDSFVWSLATGNGTIRYTINFGNGEWVEKGEQSTDNGKTWVQNFEMHLKK
jgi:hypothetical protein